MDGRGRTKQKARVESNAWNNCREPQCMQCITFERGADAAIAEKVHF